MPVILWNNRPLTCDGLPGPLVPYSALSWFVLSQASRPLRSVAGTAFLLTISKGVLLRSAIGSKSLSTIVVERVDSAVHDMRAPVAATERIAIRRRTRSSSSANTS